ncbi:hypothetical protein CMQ_6393 [Grosmannia clavigera kw1407]|uniref:HNH nuclease domain-containing protein n=1 Tax=Grosmannia clavigera (strain kw1407 / UAMH 11150) TaxID=655863 RepID=F0XL92_GROCL|nr:uncharacterized protein CMQ_6393 [Grosmannia clavigera kw1407]EFX01451.1 hypothetical protein CMQ_6393 [Grosmannia clavigera kw1407]
MAVSSVDLLMGFSKPSEDEETYYFDGLAGSPRLIAKTSTTPWETHTDINSRSKRISTVGDHHLVHKWCPELRTGIVRALSNPGARPSSMGTSNVGGAADMMIHAEALADPDSQDGSVTLNLDANGFLQLHGRDIPPQPPFACDDRTSHLVAKRGQTTGLRFGITNEIEAVRRTPFGKGQSLVSYHLLVLDFVGGHFSQPGDSGSSVFDWTGRVMGILDGGERVKNVVRYMKKYHLETGAGLPDVSDVPSQESLPEGFAQLTASAILGLDEPIEPLGDAMPGEDPSPDVTFVTPIQWILEDIREFAGFLVAGGQAPAPLPTPPSPEATAAVDLAMATIETATRAEQTRLRRDCLRRDGYRCVYSGSWEMDVHDDQIVLPPRGAMRTSTECAHIIPFALGSFNENDATETRDKAIIWFALHRYFPALREKITARNINQRANAVTLDSSVHKIFGKCKLAFSPSDEFKERFSTVPAH